ncbi:MAG TPA: MFS transporter [Novosphingobium sp.]|nr:MFS transporter [Novosphingobium sp.]
MNQTMRGGALFLLILCLANAFNLADRVLLGVLQEPLKAEFGLSDFQLGLLGGPAFAVLYSLVGLPIAWLAERANRRTIVATALALFSVMTACCGFAQNYLQLLLSRMGVSIGEAGVGPPALSLISERYPPSRRAMAMSIYAAGGPLGAILATIAGGLLAQHYGWRAGFLVFGVCGAILAVLIAVFVKDTGNRKTEGPPMLYGAAVRLLSRKGTVLHICIAAALTNACGMTIMQYMTSFLMRVHGLPLATASSVLGAGAVTGVLGIFVSGYLADRVSRHRPGASLLVCTGMFLLATPAYLLAFSSSSLVLAGVAYLIAAALLNGYTGICYAALSSVVPSTLRATTIAFYTLASNLVGYTLGPPIFGKISDMAAASHMSASGLDPAYCLANAAVPGCVAASGEGLRWALLLCCALLAVAAFHFWLASRRMRTEIVDEPVAAATA